MRPTRIVVRRCGTPRRPSWEAVVETGTDSRIVSLGTQDLICALVRVAYLYPGSDRVTHVRD